MEKSYTGDISAVINLLQGKWSVQVLCAMKERPVRLSELRRAIPSASKKGLTSILRFLEAEGFVLRKDLSESVLHVEYELVLAKQNAIVDLLDYLAQWGVVYRRNS